MADRYYYDTGGTPTGREATVVSTGAAEAGDIVALDGTGRLDITVMPLGVTAETTVCVAVEAIAQGEWVNLYLNGAVLNARLSDANNGRPINGFVNANVILGGNATVYRISNKNSNCAGLTIGSKYYASETPGAITATPPSDAGDIIQYIGVAETATEIVFSNEFYTVA